METVTGDGDQLEGFDDLVEATGEPLSAAIYSGDVACQALAMSGADQADQAQAEELIRSAGEVNPVTGFSMSVQPGRNVRVVLGFENDEQARVNADSRSVLARGPAPGQGGEFSDRFAVDRVAAEGSLVTLSLDPVRVSTSSPTSAAARCCSRPAEVHASADVAAAQPGHAHGGESDGDREHAERRPRREGLQRLSREVPPRATPPTASPAFGAARRGRPAGRRARARPTPPGSRGATSPVRSTATPHTARHPGESASEAPTSGPTAEPSPVTTAYVRPAASPIAASWNRVPAMVTTRKPRASRVRDMPVASSGSARPAVSSLRKRSAEATPNPVPTTAEIASVVAK